MPRKGNCQKEKRLCSKNSQLVVIFTGKGRDYQSGVLVIINLSLSIYDNRDESETFKKLLYNNNNHLQQH